MISGLILRKLNSSARAHVPVKYRSVHRASPYTNERIPSPSSATGKCGPDTYRAVLEGPAMMAKGASPEPGLRFGLSHQSSGRYCPNGPLLRSYSEVP